MKVLREFVFTLLIAIIIFIGLQISIKSFEVFNVSMLPTFREGNLIIVNKLAYSFDDQPRLKDEIVLYAPDGGPKPTFDPFFAHQSKCYIKRVIGVPGDTVEVKDNAVLVNGRKLVEPYINEATNGFMPERLIPEGQYFVLGDNRNYSKDSRTAGWLVPRDYIIGKVWFLYWTDNQKFPIRWVMIPVFILIVGTLVAVMIIEAKRSNRV